jgi:PTS system mannose-specific IIA component
MIGIVVVSHGRLAEELVKAAETIVGQSPLIVAVSIGWTDDPSVTNEAIKKALADVGSDGALVLTDMFGGTPTNVSLPFLSDGIDIVTGVSLPMVIKALALREGDLAEVARAVRDQGRGAIVVASELLGKTGQ